MDALFWELEQLEFEANKTDIWSYTCQRELEEYEALNANIGVSNASSYRAVIPAGVPTRRVVFR